MNISHVHVRGKKALLFFKYLKQFIVSVHSQKIAVIFFIETEKVVLKLNGDTMCLKYLNGDGGDGEGEGKSGGITLFYFQTVLQIIS